MKKAAYLLTAFFLFGCATYQSKVEKARNYLEQGLYDQALEHLKPLAEKESDDQLVYLLDYATALQISGRLSESNNTFLLADKLADSLDYHSVSRVAGSLLTSEEMVQYKGDTFEKIFINAYLAMNYLELGNLENAQVSARRMNEKYSLLRSEEKKNFELNPFAKYLSALIWESGKSWDNAYIEYKTAYSLDARNYFLPSDLIRSAKKAQRKSEYEKWKKEYPDIEEQPEWYDKNYGELVVIYQQGWGPRKDFNPQNQRYPILRPVFTETQRVRLEIQAEPAVKSVVIYDTEEAAIKTLQEDAASLAGRRLGGFVAKEVAADQIRQKNEALGFIAWIFFHVSDRADLRQWSTLPQTIQLARVYLPKGKYRVALQGLTISGSPTQDRMQERLVEVKGESKTFISWRSLH